MNETETLLAGLPADLAPEEWRPRLIPADGPEAAPLLENLVSTGRVREVCDTLLLQLVELMETRAPADDLEEDELLERAAAHLGQVPAARYGTWVYYPWSARLVHVLPEAELRELQTSRNKNKITADEQAVLAEARIGIAGLSVGQATALTLAMESVGGELRLADFDRLSLSNTNRLRAGLHALGKNKAVLAAREILELNPYARVRVFDHGITDENLEAFFEEGGRLSLLVEECDDLYMKIRLRQEARSRRIPVLMETSDRGLLDVERFDKEPGRAILHGLAEGLDPESLKGLDTYDKVPIVFRILGQTAVSPRLAASLVEVKTTLKSWPQLASAVQLGSAIATDTARRIILGQMNQSGRFYVDLDTIVADGAQHSIEVAPDMTEAPEESIRPPEAPQLSSGAAEPTTEQVRTLVTYGPLAFSGGNCQPWKFGYVGGRLSCIHDVARSESFLDYGHRAAYLAFGSVVENIHLAAMQMGFDLEVLLFPDASDPVRVCDLVFKERHDAPEDTDLFQQIPHRVTNRKLGPRVPLETSDAEALLRTAEGRGARLQLAADPELLTMGGDMLGRGDRIRFLSSIMHPEMMSEIRWSTEEAAATRDGLDVATLELSPTDLAGMRLTSAWRVMDLVGRVGGGRALEKPSRKAVAAASALGLVTAPEDSPEGFFTGGRAAQRVWLAATARGLAFQPMTAITYLWLRLAYEPETLSRSEQAELRELREVYRKLFEVPEGCAEAMLFRLARAEPPTARALRRRVEDVLAFMENSPQDEA